MLIMTLDARIARRHQKRSAPGACVSTANQQMHESFSRLINRRDEDMFAFFQPDTQATLLSTFLVAVRTQNTSIQVQDACKVRSQSDHSLQVGQKLQKSQILLEYQPRHRHLLTPKTRDCTATNLFEKSSEVLPDQPLSERSLCPYHHVLNYDEKRIPAAISEVECSCQHVKVNGGTIHCEPMLYNMRVMVFEDGCEKYVERIQKVALACIPVFSYHISSGTLSQHQPTQPSTPL
ncbi:unnamed protein product [Caenorhabditis sp. 36 PRJEB53466]|nr:unnamed protein product [Caenorhabditis sp. 36 PRJEB53466]